MRKLVISSISSFALLTTALPQSAKAELDQYSYWYGFVLGAGATMCALLHEGLVSRTAVVNYSKGFFPEIRNTSPRSARRDAINFIQTRDTMRGCPFREY